MAISHRVSIETQYKNMRNGSAARAPQRLAVFCLGEEGVSYGTTKFLATDSDTVGKALGYRSQGYQIAQALWPQFGVGLSPEVAVTFYPLAKGASAAAAAGSITPTADQDEATEYRLKVGGKRSVPFVVAADDDVADICDKMVAAAAATYDFPATLTDNSTDVDVTLAWTGTNGNEAVIEIEGPTGQVTWAITQPTGGLVNPDVSAAIAQVGEVWETFILNAFEHDDETILDAIKNFGEQRWGKNVHKPFVSLHGNTVADPTTATAVSATRATDRVNGFIPAPGSSELPCIVAAKGIVPILNIAASKWPARNYIRQPVPTLTTGTDAQQWDLAKREFAAGRGGSNIVIIDGEVKLGDVFTFWNPTGEESRAYSKVCNIVKLQNVLHNFSLVFDSTEWAGVELVASGQIVDSPTAKDDGDAVAAVWGIEEGLGRAAVLSDVENTKKLATAGIDSEDPDMMNITAPVKLSGNTDKISAVVQFGFHYGVAS